MPIFGPLGGHFRVLGRNSGPGPLRTKIFGSGESSHIVGPGKIHSLNVRFFFRKLITGVLKDQHLNCSSVLTISFFSVAFLFVEISIPT